MDPEQAQVSFLEDLCLSKLTLPDSTPRWGHSVTAISLCLGLINVILFEKENTVVTVNVMKTQQLSQTHHFRAVTTICYDQLQTCINTSS